LFDDKFGRPARGNDKGNVEGMVGYTRHDFMVPAPRYDSFELRRCSRTLRYFTPVHERATKWADIEEHIPTILRQAPLIDFMNLAQLKAA
jgi:transposase